MPHQLNAQLLTFTLLLLTAAAPIANAETFTFHHEQVLGTSLEIQITADTKAAAERAEARALAEIDRLNQIFSTYDPGSEFSRWQASQQPMRLSPELYEVLQASEHWRQRSGGAFHPAAAALSQVWRQAAQQQRLPQKAELAATVKRIQAPQWQLQDDLHARRLSDCPLSLNAIAKGAIIDRACEAAKADCQEIQSVMINIGGDLRATGARVHPIAIADPRHDAENASPLSTIYLRDRAVATSGNYRRGFQIGETWYSHIFDPRTGQPVDHVSSATVVAPTAADADALATIFSVLTVKESQQLAASLKQIEYMLVTKEGQTIVSPDWRDLETPRLFRYVAALQSADDAPQPANAQAATTPELLELVVKFELARPEKGRYRRPYVAVWLEDAAEVPVRTALLWMQTDDPGPRWHRDLLRWYRQDGARKSAGEKSLIGVVSSATRGPGEYKAIFDGKDDRGQPLKPGKYTLFLEVAREHGTYQLIRHPIALGDKPSEEARLKGNVEIKSVTVEYRSAAAAGK